MHAISYQLKRGHLCGVAIGRRIFRGTKDPAEPDYDGVHDMTPARFDILYLVLGKKFRGQREPGRLRVTSLRRALGLAPATISKALKRLTELGLVTVDFAPRSARDKVVFLTEEGTARIKRALHLVLTGRALARHYQRFIAQDYDGQRKPPAFPQLVAQGLRTLVDRFEELNRHLFDTSASIYTKVPVELDPWCALPTPMPRY